MSKKKEWKKGVEWERKQRQEERKMEKSAVGRTEKENEKGGER